MRTRRIDRVVGCLLVALAGAAGACPVCDGPTGQQVREELLDENLAVSLAATLAPFAVVAGVVAVVHFGRPGGRGRS